MVRLAVSLVEAIYHPHDYVVPQPCFRYGTGAQVRRQSFFQPPCAWYMAGVHYDSPRYLPRRAGLTRPSLHRRQLVFPPFALQTLASADVASKRTASVPSAAMFADLKIGHGSSADRVGAPPRREEIGVRAPEGDVVFEVATGSDGFPNDGPLSSLPPRVIGVRDREQPPHGGFSHVLPPEVPKEIRNRDAAVGAAVSATRLSR